MKKQIFLIILGLTLLMPIQGFAKKADTCKPLQTIFHNQVKANKGVCELQIERKALWLRLFGQIFGPEMFHFSFSANFKTVGQNTYVYGEFSLRESEIQGVIDALRSAKIEVSALHNHIYGEQPRILFLHFQGKGNQMKLAEGIKKAIESTDTSL